MVQAPLVSQDDDGAAYIAYSSEGNKVMHLARLAPSLDDVAPGYERALVGQSREAPAIFKHAGVYYLFTSGCTGWEPNRAEVFYSRRGRCPRQIGSDKAAGRGFLRVTRALHCVHLRLL